MRIRKYDFNYGRRELMKKAAIGASAGLLMPVQDLMAKTGDLGKAYPDELMSIDMYTKGKIKTGDYLTADNVDIVKDLVDPISYVQIKEMGRRIKIRKTTTDFTQMFPAGYYDRTLKNIHDGITGKFDSTGNLVTNDGKNWIGGLPFPDAKDGIQAQCNMAISWGRGDYNQYAIKEVDLSPSGEVSYNYDFVWAELQVSGRVDGTVFKNMKDKLRYQTVFFTSTPDVAGSSFLSTWYYDQRKYPDLIGYVPMFKRTRSFPANQRFEPLIPGVTWFLSDAWAAGDPMLTWGDYKILKRQPMLGAFNTTWAGGKDPNWQYGVHGGPKGQTFFDVEWELAPEAIVLESKPTGYPRAPVGRRVAWVDTRNYIFSSCIRYDRNDKPWVNFEAGFGQYKDGDKVVMGPDGKNPAWSWTYVYVFDVQSRRASRIAHTKNCIGGYESVFGGDNEKMYEKYFTQQAIQRLGSV